jgi:hypothetical protein
MILVLVDEAVAAGARLRAACEIIGLSVRTSSGGGPGPRETTAAAVHCTRLAMLSPRARKRRCSQS